MKSSISMIVLGVALMAALGIPQAVHAEEADESLAGLTGKAVELEVLDAQRGGTDAHLSEIRAVSTVKEVQVYDSVSGHNIISDGAFAGVNGIPMVIQNSGHGVSIQNATIVNLQVQ